MANRYHLIWPIFGQQVIQILPFYTILTIPAGPTGGWLVENTCYLPQLEPFMLKDICRGGFTGGAKGAMPPPGGREVPQLIEGS